MNIYEKRSGRIEFSPTSLELDLRYDVIVIGLGTAGSIAAIQAAKRGLSVLAIERMNGMGGTGTVGGVINYYYGNRGGLFESIDSEVGHYQRQDHFTPFQGVHADLKSWIMELEAQKTGIDISYESFVTGVFMEQNIIKGLRWMSPNGVHYTGAKVVIDCSGNAEVCEMAGCRFSLGRAIDGQSQPFSNVQMKMNDRRLVRNFYTDSGYVDIRNPKDLSRAVMESCQLQTHLQDWYTEESLLLKTSQLLGIRESRNIIGEEQVTLLDYLEDRYTSQPVFYAYSNLDNHSKDMALESDIQQQWCVAASLWGLSFSVPIPMGTLVPKGYEGLLAAGRCISLDHDMASCVRQKRDMQKCGETAANMAYLSISSDTPLKDLSYASLVSLQLETGCLGMEHEIGFKEIAPADANLHANVPVMYWQTDPEAIQSSLSSHKPGIAIWSAKRLGNELEHKLLQWSHQEEDLLLRKNSAIALGLINNSASLPVLREIVRTRDMYLPQSSRKYNQPHALAAIYLLGAMQDTAIMPVLIAMIKEDHFVRTVDCDSLNQEFIYDQHELYTQFFSFSMMAALRIAERHEDWRLSVIESIHSRLNEPELKLYLTLKSHHPAFIGSVKKEMNDVLRKILERKLACWGLQHEIS